MIEIPGNLINDPDFAEAIVTTKDAKQMMLDHDGNILLRGKMYNIVAVPSGAGTQRVTLKERRYE